MKVLVEYEDTKARYTLGLMTVLKLLGVEKTEAEVIKAVKKAIVRVA